MNTGPGRAYSPPPAWELFGAEHCINGGGMVGVYSDNPCVIVVAPEFMAADFCKPENQLFYSTYAVYEDLVGAQVREYHDNPKDCVTNSWRYYECIGILRPECLPAWAQTTVWNLMSSAEHVADESDWLSWYNNFGLERAGMAEMPNTITLNQLKYDALAAALKADGISVQNALQGLLEKCYEEIVPVEIRRNIETAIQQQTKIAQPLYEVNRRFSVLRVTQNDTCMHYEIDGNMQPVNYARFCKSYLDSDGGKPSLKYVDMFHPNGNEDKGYIEQTTFLDHWDNNEADRDQRVGFIIDLDFDAKTFGVMYPREEMKTYLMDDVCMAAKHAYEKTTLPDQSRQNIFDHHLAGKVLALEDFAFPDKLRDGKHEIQQLQPQEDDMEQLPY